MVDHLCRRASAGRKSLSEKLAQEIVEVTGPVPHDIQRLAYEAFAAAGGVIDRLRWPSRGPRPRGTERPATRRPSIACRRASAASWAHSRSRRALLRTRPSSSPVPPSPTRPLSERRSCPSRNPRWYLSARVATRSRTRSSRRGSGSKRQPRAATTPSARSIGNRRQPSIRRRKSSSSRPAACLSAMLSSHWRPGLFCAASTSWRGSALIT